MYGPRKTIGDSLEAEGLRSAGDLLRGRRLHGPPLCDPSTVVPRSADIEIGGIEDDRSVSLRHGPAPNPAIAIRVWSQSLRTIPSFPRPLCPGPSGGAER